MRPYVALACLAAWRFNLIFLGCFARSVHSRPSLTNKNKIVAAVLLVLYLLPLWGHPLFPSQDGPSHLYNTVVFTDLLWHPNSFFSQFYELNLRPFPNWTFTALASILHLLLPIVAVEKLILSAYLVGLVLAGFYFVRSIDAEKTPLGFGFFLFGYNWFLLMGFYNFCLSIPLALFVIGYGLRHRGFLSARRLVLMAVLFLLLYFSHLVSFGVAVLALVVSFGLFGQRRLHALGQLAIPIIPALLCFCLNYLGTTHPKAPVYWLPLPLHAANTFTFKIGPLFRIGESIWFVALWILTGYCVFRTFRSAHDVKSESQMVWSLVALAVGLCWFVPYNLLGGTALNDRFAIYVGVFLLGAISWKALQARKTLVCVAFAVLVAAQLIYLHVSFQQWNRQLGPFEKVAKHIDPGVRVLPLVFAENEVGLFVNPMLHADCLAFLQKRSATPCNYEAYLDYFPVTYKTNAPLSAPAEWYVPRSFLDRDMAKHYEYVLLWDADSSVAAHPALRQFRAVYADGKLRLLKRE